MMDWTFRITSPVALGADLDGFCDAFGYVRFTGLNALLVTGPGETFIHTEFREYIRFDMDFMRLVIVTDAKLGTTIDRGCHVNVRSSVLPKAGQVGVDALNLLDAQLRGFFASQLTTTNTAPLPLVGGQVWHTTGNTTLIDPAPNFPKRVFA